MIYCLLRIHYYLVFFKCWMQVSNLMIQLHMLCLYLQKAIKEKNIPIDGVEFMGPNKEKPDS